MHQSTKGLLTDRLSPLVKRAVALDCRSLGAFRIGLASLLLIDLVLRAFDLTAFYTDAGLLPRAMVPLSSPLNGWLAPHLFASSNLQVACLFILNGVAALALLLGIKTRWMIVACWIFLHSIQVRNPYLNHAGDRLLIVMLFWAYFLPLDRAFVPFRRETKATHSNPTPIVSWASAGILLQLASVYFLGALRKSGTMWRDGTAVEFTLQIDQYARPWTRSLLAYPDMLHGLTWLTLGIEFIAPVLLFAGIHWARLVGLVLLASLHLGFLVTMDLGLFPLISLVCLVFAVPWYERSPESRSISQAVSLPFDWRSRVAAYLTGLLLIWNLCTLFMYPDEIKASLPKPIRSGLELIRFDSYWSMFAPNPMTIDGWYLITAQTESGSTVNLLNPGAPLTRDKPSSVLASFPGDRWKEYLMTLSDLGDPPQFWAELSSYLVREYEARTAETILPDSVRVTYMMEKTTAAGELAPVPERAWPKTDP